MNQLFAQLKRRNVFRVAAAYVIVGWIVLQVASTLLTTFEAPMWVAKSITVMVILGFPLACILAWAFELTPEGVKRTHEVDEDVSITSQTGRKLDYLILTSLLILIGLTVWLNRDGSTAGPDPALSTAEQPLLTEESVTATAAEPSIAVLPFVNMSNDPDQEYFSDGISEELLNALVRIDGLDVTSRTSAFAYKGQNLSIPQIAAELNVAYILEGSVRRAGEQLRITAQLIDTQNDKHLWSETYDRTMADVFAIQSEIASAITRALRAKLGMEQDVAVTVPVLTENLSAYDLYLRGREAYTLRATQQDLTDSIRDLEQAVALDPKFTDAVELLAAGYTTAPYWGLTDFDFETYQKKALDLVDGVLAVNPDRSISWTIRGSVYSIGVGTVNWLPDTWQAYERALDLDPKNTLALHWRGSFKLDLGYLGGSRSDQERCLELEPLYWNCMDKLMDALVMQQDYTAAMGLLKKRLERFAVLDINAVWAAYLAGERMTALAIAANAFSSPDIPLREFFTALDGAGRHSGTGLEHLIAWADETQDQVESHPEILALTGAWDQIGDNFYLNGWYWYPNLKPYRQSDSFKQMIRRLGVLDFWREHGFPSQCRPAGAEDFECD